MPNSIMDTFKLSDGNEIPMEGFGTYKINEQSEMDAAIKMAYEVGYRLFDTAQFYGNEAVLGQAIKNNGIARGDIFITTKIPEPKQGYDSTLKAVDESLQRLQTDYLDLVLVHWPIHSEFFNTWRALEDAKAAGKIKSIGVSNYHRTHLEFLKTQAREMPVVNQIEDHPYLSQPTMVDFNKQAGILTQAWSPLGRGAVLKDPVIAKIGAAHNKSVAQVILRWHLQRGVSIIPKSGKPERVKQNADIYDFTLSDEEMNMINDLNKNQRTGDDPELVYELEHQYH
ncbi:aldo/keto reductase [Nicoliella spurrieriana]|uniref:Aldo/keto reductase n=1 Tax=Nicoliella spurrieriana TaxID=2925830 RepID=A0A976RSU0_9LACO|nr:aldo/keto reductase [Nicoliella spurrieriana]UQS87169.1 aldo/keto reductase [Nicoliella spurrieriana]